MIEGVECAIAHLIFLGDIVKARERKLEADFQADLILDLKDLFPGCFIMKNDESLIQGIPDLTILYKNTWAVLEVKAYEGAAHQPNQDYYVDLFDGMSYAAFIFPENKEEVLDELQQTFGAKR